MAKSSWYIATSSYVILMLVDLLLEGQVKKVS